MPPGPWDADVAPWRRSLDRAVLSGVEVVVDALLPRWGLIASLGAASIVLGAYLPPALVRLGRPEAGRALFAAYSAICTQTPEHSYFPWGYEPAIDQRPTAIYGAFALLRLAYHQLGERVRPLRWRGYSSQ